MFLKKSRRHNKSRPEKGGKNKKGSLSGGGCDNEKIMKHSGTLLAMQTECGRNVEVLDILAIFVLVSSFNPQAKTKTRRDAAQNTYTRWCSTLRISGLESSMHCCRFLAPTLPQVERLHRRRYNPLPSFPLFSRIRRFILVFHTPSAYAVRRVLARAS